MRVKSVDLSEILDWGELTELSVIILMIGAYIMLHRRVVASGVVAALALLVVWGIFRDPLLLAAALVMGFIAGFVAWLLR